MISFSNCKINLGLAITAKRPDGYHDIETCFYPVPLEDVLEIIPNHDTSILSNFQLQVSGSYAVPTDTNLCVKAYQLLQQLFPGQLSPVKAFLHKTIPTGAGLGGGSSNAAFTLLLLNNLFQLNLSQGQLAAYSLQLGSDCPFFIYNTPCLATGRGEKLTPFSFDLSAYHLVLVNPGIEIATKEAFSNIQPAPPIAPLASLLKLPITEWKYSLKNDFEAGIFQQYPAIGHIKEVLYQQGALYSSMSGTGSTVYGLFKEPIITHNLFPLHYLCKILSL